MAKVTVGGDPESYMDAPRVSSGGGGGGNGSFIAQVLDFLGIHKAKGKVESPEAAAPEPAPESAPAPESKLAQAVQAPPAGSESNGAAKLLDSVESGLGWPNRTLDNNLLTPIDPDIAALLPRVKL